MQIINPFPVRLKEARDRLGISQRELGVRIGFEPDSASSRMNHYEKGRHMPDFATLQRIAEELQVPLAYLFCESDDMAEMVKAFDKLTPEDKLRAIEIVKNASMKNGKLDSQ